MSVKQKIDMIQDIRKHCEITYGAKPGLKVTKDLVDDLITRLPAPKPFFMCCF